jgi:hypothetical protein
VPAVLDILCKYSLQADNSVAEVNRSGLWVEACPLLVPMQTSQRRAHSANGLNGSRVSGLARHAGHSQMRQARCTRFFSSSRLSYENEVSSIGSRRLLPNRGGRCHDWWRDGRVSDARHPDHQRSDLQPGGLRSGGRQLSSVGPRPGRLRSQRSLCGANGGRDGCVLERFFWRPRSRRAQGLLPERKPGDISCPRRGQGSRRRGPERWDADGTAGRWRSQGPRRGE